MNNFENVIVSGNSDYIVVQSSGIITGVSQALNPEFLESIDLDSIRAFQIQQALNPQVLGEVIATSGG